MIETRLFKNAVRIVNSAVAVNGLFVAEQIYRICEVSIGERGFYKKEFLLDGFTDCTVVDLTELKNGRFASRTGQRQNGKILL